MTVYRRKTSKVEAFQFKKRADIPGSIEAPDGSVYIQTTAATKVRLTPGVYVVGTVPGNQQVLTPAEFNAKYETIEYTPPAEEKPAKKEKAVKEEKPAKEDKPKAAKKKATKKKAAKKVAKKTAKK